jgi:hypothetical protein
MPIQPPAVNQDEEHLRLLAVFHYVAAGIAALFALFPVIHLIVGLFLVFGASHFKNGGTPPPPFVGWFFIIFACFFILAGLTMAILILINGRCLAKRRHYTFCQVMSGIECLFMPFGTILGVFTLVVLSRPSVKPLFGQNPAAPGYPGI